VDLVWNAILATQAQRKESVFEELEGGEEEVKPNLSAFGEPRPILETRSATLDGFVVLESITMYNDTVPTLVDDVEDPTKRNGQFNTTSDSAPATSVA
jgi:hypothetical protein